MSLIVVNLGNPSTTEKYCGDVHCFAIVSLCFESDLRHTMHGSHIHVSITPSNTNVIVRTDGLYYKQASSVGLVTSKVTYDKTTYS